MTTAPQWFARVGTTLSTADVANATAILVARGSPAPGQVVQVASWREAANWSNDAQLAQCWDDDEDAREALWLQVAAEIGEAALLGQLTRVTTASAAEVHAAARTAAGVAAARDPDDVATAAASALLSLHQATLAQLAQAASDHPFNRKFALFAHGRWALGYRDGTYGIF